MSERWHGAARIASPLAALLLAFLFFVFAGHGTAFAKAESAGADAIPDSYTLTVKVVDGASTETVVLDKAALAGKLNTDTVAANYYKSGWRMIEGTDYVTVDDILGLAGYTPQDSDTISLGGSKQQFSYKAINSGYFYPRATVGAGGSEVWGEPTGDALKGALMFTGYVYETKSSSMAEVVSEFDGNAEAFDTLPLSFYGADIAAGITGGNRFMTGATELVVTKDPNRVLFTVKELGSTGTLFGSYAVTKAMYDKAQGAGHQTQHAAYYKDGWRVQRYTDYITLPELFQSLGLDVADDDVIAYDLGGKAAQVAYGDAKAGMFYPRAQSTGGTVSSWGEGIATPPLVALKAFEYRSTGDDLASALTAVETSAASALGTPLGAFGMNLPDNTGGNRLWTGVDTLYITHPALNVAQAKATFAASTFTGKALTPAATVTVRGRTLKAGTDYTIVYANNVNAGTATATIAGKGDYAGTLKASFAIAAAPITAVKIKSTSLKYTGKAQKPAVTSVSAGSLAVASSGYTVAYANNKNVGKGTVTVTGKGNYTGVKKVSFSINAAKGQTFTIGAVKYKVTKANAELSAVGTTKKSGSVTVPATAKVGGKALKVTAVADKAFYGKKVSSVSLGSNIKKIGKQAFAKCTRLKTLKISSKTVSSFGKSMVSGAYAKMKVKVPASKVKTYTAKIKKTGGFKSTMAVVRA